MKQAEQAKTVIAQVRILEFSSISKYNVLKYKFDRLEHVRCSLTKSGRHVLDN